MKTNVYKGICPSCSKKFAVASVCLDCIKRLDPIGERPTILKEVGTIVLVDTKKTKTTVRQIIQRSHSKCHECGSPGIFHDMCAYCQRPLCPWCMEDGCCGHDPAVSYWLQLAKDPTSVEPLKDGR